MPQPPARRSRYWRQDLAVPKTRKVTSDAVTPGMKRRMSMMALLVEKSGRSAAAMEALVLEAM